MIKVTTEQEGKISIEIEGTGKDIFAEMCILFCDLRKKYKKVYLLALKYARESNQEESEEDD